jgi:hypothetical protein
VSTRPRSADLPAKQLRALENARPIDTKRRRNIVVAPRAGPSSTLSLADSRYGSLTLGSRFDSMEESRNRRAGPHVRPDTKPERQWCRLAGRSGYATVLLDGSVVVPSVLDAEHFQLTFVRPAGAVETQVVNVPNGALWYPYRAVPNGQGGLLVQMRRWFWRDWAPEVVKIDALVVGVDAAGTLTGQTPLADDWGEIVVGANGNILVTSQVEYWTDPGYGSVPKTHVGFLQAIGPAGNPAGSPTFYPPSGPCGWQWDGLSQSWYYNGDCDQEVLSITSIPARGADTFVTLSNGSVFASGPLGQLHLSYLVPASDGTYLGVGAPTSGLAAAAAARGAAADTAEAGALMAFTVPSEEPVSPFGAEWTTAGGGVNYAQAAPAPSGIKLLGDDAARRAQVRMFQDALAQDESVPIGAQQRLWDNQGYLDIKGDIGTFRNLGRRVRAADANLPSGTRFPVETSIAMDIANLAKPGTAGRIIEFGVTADTDASLDDWGVLARSISMKPRRHRRQIRHILSSDRRQSSGCVILRFFSTSPLSPTITVTGSIRWVGGGPASWGKSKRPTGPSKTSSTTAATVGSTPRLPCGTNSAMPRRRTTDIAFPPARPIRPLGRGRTSCVTYGSARSGPRTRPGLGSRRLLPEIDERTNETTRSSETSAAFPDWTRDRLAHRPTCGGRSGPLVAPRPSWLRPPHGLRGGRIRP